MADLAPISLWMTDRSRYETGVDHCPRDRYLSYHAGPHGYGWAAKAQSVPLVSGTMLAGVQEKLHYYVKEFNGLPTEAFYYNIISAAREEYLATVATRGLSNVIDAADLDLRVNEQLTLLEGLAWVWYFVALPQILTEWKIVGVETERTSILSCTCGLGDRIGTPEEHDARECQGFVWMSRGDFLTEHRTIPNRYAYHECKAPGETNVNTDAAWEYRVQLLAGLLGEEDARGIRVDEIYLHQSIKGKRQREYDPLTKGYTGPKYQNSPLVYAWYRPGNPPISQEEWRLKVGNKPAGFSKVPIWEMRQVVAEWEGALSPAHYWVKWLGAEVVSAQYRRLGPIARSEDRLQQFLRQLAGEEARWRDHLWVLYGMTEREGKSWGDPEFMALLDGLVPQNRGQACHSYYGEPCQKLGLCDKLAGWEAPELLGYIPRRPHHQPELLQAIGRGLLPPDEGLIDEGEE